MKHTTLGGIEVSRLGLGTMGMSLHYAGAQVDDTESTRTIRRAIDLGVTFFDTAERYGPYINEELLGNALGADRSKVVVATKFGTILHRGDGSHGRDGSPENLRLAIEGSLKRLGTDYIDLYYQHRVDPAISVEETVGALAELIREGKIRGYGLSEAAVSTIRRAHAVHPVTAIQTEYSLWSRDPEAELLPTLAELGIGFVPYSPLGHGFLTGTIDSTAQFDAKDFRASNPRFTAAAMTANQRIVDEIAAVAKDVGATPTQTALAWILAQGEHIAPIPGTKRVARLEENVGADEIVLSTEQLARLGAIGAPVGDRYPDMSAIGG